MPESGSPAWLQLRSRYFLEYLAAFLELRDDSAKILVRYQQRLISLNSDQTKPEAVAKRSSPSAFVKIYSRVSRLLGWLAKTPLFFRQYNRIKNDTHGANVFALACSSKRLLSSAVAMKPRDYLASLGKASFSDAPYDEVARKITETKHLIIFEPESDSPLWQAYADLESDGLYICDGQFLIFVALWTLLKGNARLFGHLLRSRGSGMSKSHLLIGALIFDSYKDLFSLSDRVEGVFYTSNSFFTEVLRCFLIQHEKCPSVCEIMHGAPTTVYERFIAGILRAGVPFAAKEKHSSIGLIPNLPEFGALVEDCKLPLEIAINTYLNRYVCENSSKASDFRDQIRLRSQSLFGDLTKNPETLVVTFIGGTSSGRDFFESGLFDAECSIMRDVIMFLRSKKRPFAVVYSAHPAHPRGKLEAHPFFNQNPEMRVYPNTVFSWFVSDISLALFSGAVFEAVYFGSKTFAPMRVEDDLYPAEILAWVAHQSQADSYKLDLDQFLMSCMDLKAESINEKIESRTNKLNAQGVLSHKHATESRSATEPDLQKLTSLL